VLAVSCLIIAFAETMTGIVLFVPYMHRHNGCSAAIMPAIKGVYFGRRIW